MRAGCRAGGGTRRRPWEGARRMFRTLLVDDREIFIRELMRCGVWGEETGFCVSGQAANGCEALDLLQAGRYDLLLTDIRMPKVDGIELLKEVKKQNLCPCVVLLSEYREFTYARQGLVLGAFDYLTKPLGAENLRELFARVHHYLDEHRIPAGADGEVLTFAAAKAKRIAESLFSGRDELDALLGNTLDGMYEVFHQSTERTALAAGHLLDNVVSLVWEQCPWMRLFYRAEAFDGETGETFADVASCRRFLREKLESLRACIHKFMPVEKETVVGRVCLHMLEHPEDEISLKAMAGQFYINRSYLSNTFHKKTGYYFNEYLTMIRMERARYLLETEDLKIYEIYPRLGYHDQEYFGRLFKKIVGVSPAAFRRGCAPAAIR